MGEELVRVAGQQSHDLPLGGREPHVCPIGQPDLFFGQVDAEIGRLDNGDFVAGGGSPQRHPEAGYELVHPEGLAYLIVGPGIQRYYLLSLRCTRRQDDYRDLCPWPR